MNDHDKFDCHIIKEMIINNKLSIYRLNQKELNLLIDYEMDLIAESPVKIDNSFLNLCLDALKKYENYDEIISLEEQRKIGEKTYQKFLEKKSNDASLTIRKVPSFRKTIRYFIAAAILLVALTATVAAVWNPFVSWLKERKLIDVEQGEVLENDEGSFASDTYRSFSSIDEMEYALDLHIEIFDHISSSPKSIKFTTQGTEKTIIAQYNIEQKEVYMKIYLENAPYKQEAMENSELEIITINEIDGYIIKRNEVQFITFKDKYVYIIISDSLNTIIQFMEG